VTEDDSARSATLAGIVASGIARRFDYRAVSFTVSRAPRPGVDNVLIGKRAFAAKVAGPATTLRASKGGVLRVMPMVDAKGAPDPKRALLVVTGDTDEAVKLAAITFTNISFRFPGTEELEAFGFSIPDVKQYSGRETIATDQVYELTTRARAASPSACRRTSTSGPTSTPSSPSTSPTAPGSRTTRPSRSP